MADTAYQDPVPAAEIGALFDRLWPIHRSITGPGVRETHDILGEILPLNRMEIPTGTNVFDWTVPQEWRCHGAHITGPDGQRIADVATNNLHLVGYSVPFRGVLARDELDAHLYSLPEQPDAIPYVTSYYTPRWGFCLPHAQRQALPDGQYDVVVDTELVDGALTLSEAVLEGESEDEILFSTYTCHPSMANNELSGPIVAALLYRRLAALPRRHFTYRFAFLAETIGALAYLNARGDLLRERLKAGYVVTCVGDDGPYTYKHSRAGNTLADRAARHALEHLVPAERIRYLDFDPSDGSDERQYGSPGFDLPVGSLSRTIYAAFPQYHTSLDNRDFVSFDALSDSIEAYVRICQVLEANGTFENLVKFGEPNLGKRGLYPTMGGAQTVEHDVRCLLWLLNQSDGTQDLLAIAARSGLPIDGLRQQAERCLDASILAEVTG